MRLDAAAEEHFGPYVVYERLGVGGMATVHRALERNGTGFERTVALKRLLPHLAEDASFIKSFVREAKLASLLAHVNIVQIYELGRVGTEYFISMEYIDGRDVRQLLRHARKVTGPPPIHFTVGLLLQLCDALDYAHNKVDDDGTPLELVHRDVSPANLLVASSGNLKVIDFGIAKAQSSQLRTQTGRVKGKLAYMAPEAVSGSRDLDARSDIWAAGVILHELLTARPLFASKNEYQTLLKVQRGDIAPPSTLNHACPPELDAIVAQALARDPDERFAGAAELRTALGQVCRKYQLQTSARDVVKWLDWAFSQPRDASERDAAPEQRSDEDDAVAIAWGGGETLASGPVVLDDVPDVSGKHLVPVAGTDSFDEIPTPRTAPPTPLPRARAITAIPRLDVPNLNDRMAALRLRDQQLAARVDPHRLATVPSSELVDEEDDATILNEHDAASDPDVELARHGVRSIEPSARASEPGPAKARPPRTRPGVAPASAHHLAPFPKKPELNPIGAAVVTRPKPRRWVMLAGLVIVGGAATGVTLFATTGAVPVKQLEPSAAPPSSGTIKFTITPSDAEMMVDDQAHTGSPWEITLAAGRHQVELRRPGYKSWLTSIELSPGGVRQVRVELVPLGTPTAGDVFSPAPATHVEPRSVKTAEPPSPKTLKTSEPSPTKVPDPAPAPDVPSQAPSQTPSEQTSETGSDAATLRLGAPASVPLPPAPTSNN